MRIVIFTSIKPVLSQIWLLNELNLFEKTGLEFMLLYDSLAVSERQYSYRKFNKYMTYIQRFPKDISGIIKYLILHIGNMISHPLNYARIIFALIIHFNFIYLRDFFKIIALLDRIFKFKPDIFFSHYTRNPYVFTYLMSKFFAKRFGLISHSTYNYPSYVLHLHKEADFIVVKSEYLKRDYLKKYPEIPQEKITVLPWGIDTEFFRPIKSSISEVSLADSGQARMTILSISRFAEMKGIIYLLKACRLLANENIKFRCILVGYGRLKRTYQQFIRKNSLEDYVKILPPIPHSARLKKLLAPADVFVLPAVIDNKTGEQDFIPNAVLEAMAMEKVVITTKVTGMQEVAKDGESIFFTKEKDPVDLANKIKMVIKLSEEEKTQGSRLDKSDISRPF